MKLKLKFFDCLCSTSVFEINGIDAYYDDFGKKYDTESHSSEDYSCNNMEFFPYEASDVILKKYKITNDEHKEICKKLKEGLSFGRCGWCV